VLIVGSWSPGKDVILCLLKIVHARARRRFQRGLKRRPMGLIKKLRKAKKEAPPNEKPAVVKTHLRDMIIVPEMIGSVVGIYNGKVCSSVGLGVRCRC
jgi:ribosomal protein uS19